MSLPQIFKRILIPCAVGVSSANSDKKSGGHTYGHDCAKKNEDGEGTKPSDLPLYSKACPVCKEDPKSPPPSNMEETVGYLRRELWVWQDNLKGYRHKIIDVYRKGFSKADSVIDYLRQESHGPQRLGAIGISGLAGYIYGMRHCGMFRRLLYGTCGALGMAAICYPTEAADYLETVVLEGRRYFIVAYHFVYGESPQMPEWLEKYIGKQQQQEIKAIEQPNTKESMFDLEKILPSGENKEKKS